MNLKVIAQLLLALNESTRARLAYDQDYRDDCGCEKCVEIRGHIALIEEVSNKKFDRKEGI